jgi:hypothetical protein
VSRYAVRVGVLVFAALSAGCDDASNLADHIAGHRASPFALFGRDDMRAGLRFDVLRHAAKKESTKQYECVGLWARAQRCSVPIESGMLSAVVDSTGHVIRLLAFTDPILRNGLNVHGQLIYRDVVRDTRAAWDSVGSSHVDDSDPAAPQMRWLDRSSRWGSSLWYSRAHRADVPRSSGLTLTTEMAMTLPESIGVTDLPAYAVFVQRQPTPPGVPEATATARRDSTPLRPPIPDEILTMLRSDLRAVAIAEEEAVHQTGRYVTRLDSLHITRTAGVTLELLRSTPDGWSAVASHPGLPGLTCVLFAGNVDNPPSTQKERRRAPTGEIACDRP